MKKKIAWITSDCFVDCDFDFDILKTILSVYDIDWYILLPIEESRYTNFDFTRLEVLNGIRIIKFHFYYRNGSIKRFGDYNRLRKLIRCSVPDIVYINCPPTPLLLLFVLTLKSSNTIVTSHQGEVHKGFTSPWKHRIIRYIMYNKVRYINMFSKSQSLLMAKHFRNAQIFNVNLSLKKFGEPDSNLYKDNRFVSFLSFGTINYGKHIDMLIDAACELYADGKRNIRVRIYGQCNNWEFYKKRILYPDIFDCKISMIDNSEIPNLFSSSHFFVQPYRIVTQSGPLKIAFNYNVPVICSNLPGFTDEVVHGVNGFLFEANNVDNLKKMMLLAIKMVEDDRYFEFCNRMEKYTNIHYDPLKIGEEYVNMFNKINREL